MQLRDYYLENSPSIAIVALKKVFELFGERHPDDVEAAGSITVLTKATSLSPFNTASPSPLLEETATLRDEMPINYVNAKERLRQLIIENSLKRGNITLASGWESDHYYDMKEITLQGEGSYLIPIVFFSIIKNDPPASVGGLEIGSIPITASLVGYAYSQGLELNGFYVRQKPKEHGLKKLIEGKVKTPVTIVDDVITTGSSTMKAVQAVQEGGFEIQNVITIVDRGEEFRSKKPMTFGEELKEIGVSFGAIFTDAELYNRTPLLARGTK